MAVNDHKVLAKANAGGAQTWRELPDQQTATTTPATAPTGVTGTTTQAIIDDLASQVQVLRGIQGQYVGSSATVAGLPTTATNTTLGNGDWAILTVDEGGLQEGIVVFDGTNWADGLPLPTLNTTLLGLSDTPATMGAAGQVLSVNAGGTALEFTAAVATLASLTDVPAATAAGQVLTRNATNDGYEWTTPAAGVTLGSTAGVAAGTAAAGTAGDAARSDHVHPSELAAVADGTKITYA